MMTFKTINKIILLLCISLCSSASLYAKSINHTIGVWSNLTYIGHVKKNDRWLYQLGFEHDFKNYGSLYDTNILTAGIGYTVSQTSVAWLGYDFLSTLNDPTNSFDHEQRLWQSITYQLFDSKNLAFDARTRFEQRNDLDYSSVAFRLRQKFSLSFKNLGSPKITPSLTDEFLFNLNHPSWLDDRNIFDENRFYIGANITINKNMSVFVAYLNQFQVRDKQNIMNHILDFELTVT